MDFASEFMFPFMKSSSSDSEQHASHHSKRHKRSEKAKKVILSGNFPYFLLSNGFLVTH